MAAHAGDKAIVISNDVRDGYCWQLGSLALEAAPALIGWTMEGPDGGVPFRVVRTLARTFVHYGRVTFPCSTVPVVRGAGWRELGPDYVTTVRLKPLLNWRETLAALFRSSNLPLLSTSREESV